jgi:hypothetical protein
MKETSIPHASFLSDIAVSLRYVAAVWLTSRSCDRAVLPDAPFFVQTAENMLYQNSVPLTFACVSL